MKTIKNEKPGKTAENAGQAGVSLISEMEMSGNNITACFCTGADIIMEQDPVIVWDPCPWVAILAGENKRGGKFKIQDTKTRRHKNKQWKIEMEIQETGVRSPKSEVGRTPNAEQETATAPIGRTLNK